MTVIVRGRNTQARKRTKRSTVAAALAATMTPSSTAWLAAGARTPSRARAPVVRPSPSPKMIRPWNWWRAAPSRPRTPKVSRRFAAVFAMLVSSSATTFAAIAPIIPRNSRNSSRCATVLATPIAANRTSWRGMAVGTPGTLGASGARPSCARSSATGSAPEPSARPTRQMPRRSAIAVATMSTRESGSSTQSTGTSWIRRPARSASTSISVSKNQPVSSTSGSSRRATSARMALKPHWASVKPVCRVPRSSRL